MSALAVERRPNPTEGQPPIWRRLNPLSKVLVKAADVAYRLTATRAVMIVFGVVSGFWAYATYYSYTTDTLVTRNWCVMVLIVMCVVGAGSLLVPPNPVTRASMGFMLVVHSHLRGSAFALNGIRESTGVLEFLQTANGVYVHLLLGYMGLLIWGRSRLEVVR